MLRAVLNKSWRQHPTRLQLYGHLPPITKTIQVRRTRHAGHCWRSKDELISDVLLWTPTYGCAKVGRPARTYIQQLCEDTGCNLKTCRRRWMIGRNGERGSGISALAARHDDDDDTLWYNIFFIIQRVKPCTIPCRHQPPTRGDNTASVAQGGTASPGAIKQLLPPDKIFKRKYSRPTLL